MSNVVRTTASDLDLVRGVLHRIAADVGTILGHSIALGEARCERALARPAGEGAIHISFKLALRRTGADDLHGCLLVPLAEAITWAGFLLMHSDEAVAARREDTTLEADAKHALLEIGNLIAGATHTALAELGLPDWRAASRGCQGVRAGVRPAFPYAEGSELLVGRVEAHTDALPAARWILVLPPPV